MLKNDSEIVELEGKQYIVALTNVKKGSTKPRLPFVVDFDKLDLIKDIPWHSSGGYISGNNEYLHNVIMANLSPGQGTLISVDHINHIGMDNRGENLHLTDCTGQNFNQTTKTKANNPAKTKKLHEAGLQPEDLPRCCYLSLEKKRGDKFCIEIGTNKDKFSHKTTSSKQVSLKLKLEEAKLTIRAYYSLDKRRQSTKQMLDAAQFTQTSFIALVELAGYNIPTIQTLVNPFDTTHPRLAYNSKNITAGWEIDEYHRFTVELYKKLNTYFNIGGTEHELKAPVDDRYRKITHGEKKYVVFRVFDTQDRNKPYYGVIDDVDFDKYQGLHKVTYLSRSDDTGYKQVGCYMNKSSSPTFLKKQIHEGKSCFANGISLDLRRMNLVTESYVTSHDGSGKYEDFKYGDKTFCVAQLPNNFTIQGYDDAEKRFTCSVEFTWYDEKNVEKKFVAKSPSDMNKTMFFKLECVKYSARKFLKERAKDKLDILESIVSKTRGYNMFCTYHEFYNIAISSGYPVVKPRYDIETLKKDLSNLTDKERIAYNKYKANA